MKKVKITVLRKEFYPEYAEDYHRRRIRGPLSSFERGRYLYF